MTIRQTHTYAILEVSTSVYDEIAASLREAGYDHVFMENGAIDMHGIALMRDIDDETQAEKVGPS